MSAARVSDLQFSHQLAHQAIHDALEPKFRARLHALALDILEELHPRSPPGLAHELAWHAAQALHHPPDGRRPELERRQFEYLKQIAAEAALGVRYDEIRSAFTAVCDHPRADDAARLAALMAWGDCAWRLGQSAEAAQRYRAALQLAEKLARLADRFHCLNNLGVHLRECGEMEEAESLLQAALALARELKEPRLEIRALGNIVGYLHAAGRAGEALIISERTYALSVESGDGVLQALSLSNLATFQHHLGRFREAEANYERAAAMLRELGRPQQQAIVFGNLAILKRGQGAMEEGHRLLEEALQAARHAGLKRYQAQFTGQLASDFARQGLDDQAQAMHLQARATLREVGDRHGEGLATGNHAIFARDRGELARSMSLFAEADELMDGGSGRDMQAAMRGVRAALRTLLGDFAGAESDLEFVDLFLSPRSFGTLYLEYALIPRIRLALARAAEPALDAAEFEKALVLADALEAERQRLNVLDTTELGEICLEVVSLIRQAKARLAGAEPPLCWRGYAPARLDPRLRLALLERLRQYEPQKHAQLVQDGRLHQAMLEGTPGLPLPDWRGV
ncbi:tetratricopeptide repeat protein [bacterium]|nr:MAG: tetratricopeptide repeat protein [bacterium]RIK62082.1 MAG: hypothetical protein DCC64_11240 [Planctomycetota bacterium]